MLAKVKGIVIHKVNYSDTSVIAKVFTNVYGLQSYLISGVKNNKGAIRQSHLMPLNLLELEVYHQQQKNLQRIKELKCLPVLTHLHFDITKSSVALFMAELLHKTIKDEAIPDAALFSFLYHAIQILDATDESITNFPLYFMIRLSAYLGFEPKQNYSPAENVFSLSDGAFISNVLFEPTACSEPTSEALNKLLQAGFDNLHEIKLSSAQREELFDELTRYYEMHEISLGNLHSYKVLKQVYN